MIQMQTLNLSLTDFGTAVCSYYSHHLLHPSLRQLLVYIFVRRTWSNMIDEQSLQSRHDRSNLEAAASPHCLSPLRDRSSMRCTVENCCHLFWGGVKIMNLPAPTSPKSFLKINHGVVAPNSIGPTDRRGNRNTIITRWIL